MSRTASREASGPTREHGVEHGAIRGRRTWSDRRAADANELGITRQPYVLVVGGGQGGIGLGARLKRIGVPALDRRPAAAPGDAYGGGATSRSACMIRSGTTICRTCRFPIIGRSIRPRTRWATGSGLYPNHGTRLLAGPLARAAWDGPAGVDGRGRARRGNAMSCGPSISCCRPECRASRDAAPARCRAIRRRPASFQPARRRRGLGAKAASSLARTTRRTTSPPICGSTVPT